MHRFCKGLAWALMVSATFLPHAMATSNGDSNVLQIPFIAVGGAQAGPHLVTVLSLEDSQTSTSSGIIELFSDDGEPLPVQLNQNSQLAAHAEWTVLPRRSDVMILTHPDEALQVGSARVSPTGNSPIEITAVIQLFEGDNLVDEARIHVVPAPQALASLHASTLSAIIPAWPFLKSAAYPTAKILPVVQHDLITPRRHILISAPNVTSLRSSYHRRRQRATWAPRFIQTGFASWYGGSFDGRRAASGSPYDHRNLTAAHRTLPFGTWARITNLRNGRSVLVRVIDRGPFVQNRIVDLSAEAAREIGILNAGIIRVRLEALPS